MAALVIDQHHMVANVARELGFRADEPQRWPGCAWSSTPDYRARPVQAEGSSVRELDQRGATGVSPP